MTRSRVSGAMGTAVGASLSTRDTVLCDTSAAAAMSRMVTTGRRTVDDPDRAGTSSGAGEDPGGVGDIAARLA
jgi:hypothetical protein